MSSGGVDDAIATIAFDVCDFGHDFLSVGLNEEAKGRFNFGHVHVAATFLADCEPIVIRTDDEG